MRQHILYGQKNTEVYRMLLSSKKVIRRKRGSSLTSIYLCTVRRNTERFPSNLLRIIQENFVFSGQESPSECSGTRSWKATGHLAQTKLIQKTMRDLTMRKFRKIGVTALSVMAIIAVSAGLVLHSTHGKAFEITQPSGGLDQKNIENAQAGSVATLAALRAIFAELQLREAMSGPTDSTNNFEDAISRLSDAQNKFAALKWVDDRKIDLSNERPELWYFNQRISTFLEENDRDGVMFFSFCLLF